MNEKIKEEIEQLKEEKNAIILAHNYQPNEIQEIADFIGDSLELCIKASELENKDLIIFCGVDFMAETAYILNPNKKIVLPDLEAECPMAHMLNEKELTEAIEKHPDAGICLYVNSLAESKQAATILCTSANALKVVESLYQDIILFGPDSNLGKHVAEKTSKKIIPIPSDGHCYVHKKFTVEDINLKRAEYPNADVICHPECNIEVQEASDAVLSTGGMLSYIGKSNKEEFIMGTEVDMLNRIKANFPNKKVYPLRDDAICENMKVHTIEKVRDALKNEAPEIKLDKKICEKSLKAVKRMLSVSN